MDSLNYVDRIKNLKNKVHAMMQERSRNLNPAGAQVPSEIWAEDLGVFDYLMNLSEDNFTKIRYHTNLITGEFFSYWHQYPPINPEKFARMVSYSFYTEGLPESCWIGEPPVPRIPRPLGVNYKGRVINRSISRYQSCLSNLYCMGIIEEFQKNKKRNLVIEVGGGYGALAHHIGEVLGKSATYVILDFPEMLLFSGGNLINSNPGKNIYVYDRSTFTPDFLSKGIYQYDFALLPHYLLKELYAVREVNLFLNMMSYQEMTEEQLAGYFDFAASKLSGYLYSDNMDRHPCNNHLKPRAVTRLLSERFKLFPSPDFYEKNCRECHSMWFYKTYLGVPKKDELKFLAKGPMKIVGGESKIGGAEYSIFYDDGKTTFKVKRNLSGFLIGFARKAMRKILKEDLTIYYQMASEN